MVFRVAASVVETVAVTVPFVNPTIVLRSATETPPVIVIASLFSPVTPVVPFAV